MIERLRPFKFEMLRIIAFLLMLPVNGVLTAFLVVNGSYISPIYIAAVIYSARVAVVDIRRCLRRDTSILGKRYLFWLALASGPAFLLYGELRFGHHILR